MRLFIAIEFPLEIRRYLAQAADNLFRQAKSGRFVSLDNFHLTLVFIGECKRVDEVEDIMWEVCSNYSREPFDMGIAGIGSFKQRGESQSQEHTWWVGVKQTPELQSLARDLANALRDANFAIQKRSYKPHITLGRGVTTNKPIALAIPPQNMEVTHISLMRSELTRNGPIYTQISAAPLGKN